MIDWDFWNHQQTEVDERSLEPEWFQYWDPRTGKSRPCVFKVGVWIARAGVRRILIAAPKSACQVWLKEDELGRFDDSAVRVVDLSDGPVVQRGVVLESLRAELRPTIVVVNRSVLYPLTMVNGRPGPLRRWNPDALVLDEVHEYKTPSAACSRAALMLAPNCKFKLGLTGTPDPEDYEDYYGQFKIVSPQTFEFPIERKRKGRPSVWEIATTKEGFDARYIQRNAIFPSKIDNYLNVDELRAKVFSKSSRVRQEDCFDMPAVRDITVPVHFTKLVRELYDELVANATAEYFGLDIDALHQLTRITVLHELCAGFIKNGKETEWVFDGKIKATLGQVEDLVSARKRVVVLHHYRAEGARLVEELRKKYGKEVVRDLHGDTPGRDRSPTPFKTWPNMLIYVAQEDTANMAISMREADHVVWTSWGTKSNVHYQARQRIFDQAEQKPHGLTYTYLEVPNSVDGTNRNIITRKRSASDALLNYGFEAMAYGRAA